MLLLFPGIDVSGRKDYLGAEEIGDPKVEPEKPERGVGGGQQVNMVSINAILSMHGPKPKGETATVSSPIDPISQQPFPK